MFAIALDLRMLLSTGHVRIHSPHPAFRIWGLGGVRTLSDAPARSLTWALLSLEASRARKRVRLFFLLWLEVLKVSVVKLIIGVCQILSASSFSGRTLYSCRRGYVGVPSCSLFSFANLHSFVPGPPNVPSRAQTQAYETRRSRVTGLKEVLRRSRQRSRHTSMTSTYPRAHPI